MHSHEPDGINEALAGTLRVALTVAGQVAERAARAYEQAARRAQAASEQEARELQARLDAERAAARAALAPVQRPEWWQHAQPDDIAQAWQTAQTWRELDVEAAAAADRIRAELRERYQLDPSDLGVDPAAARDGLAARGNALDATAEELARDRGEAAEAAALLASADRAAASQAREHAQETGVDAGDHLTHTASREQLAAALEGVADAETVQARVVAATNQGRPAAEAVSAPPKRAPRARRARATGVVRERGRGR